MISSLERSLVKRFGGSAPRYTSYPTAPQFHDGVSAATYADWLARLPATEPISLYLHIPFCGTLCWFCACRSQGARRYDLVARYLEALSTEIALLAEHIDNRPIRSIHWGGGSPTILSPEDIRALSAQTRAAFAVAPDAEFAVEIDARDMDDARLDAVAEAGVTRASVGVQDFDPTVQKAINREQSFEQTAAVIEGLRARGVESVNIDALYGLPHQTLEGVTRTIDQLVALSPDRVALFGYAHVPWMARRQQLIDDEALPDAEERLAQATAAAERLIAAGHQRIGLDHFAKPSDAMAVAACDGTLRRNFQGYTVDDADTMIGLGASAIGRTPSGYVQNAPSTADYQKRVAAGAAPIIRGVAFTAEDRVRADAIERLMCDLEIDLEQLRTRHGDLATLLRRDLAHALETLPPEVLEPTPRGLRVTEAGRPFLRNVAALFDAYLATGEARFSRAV
ncbi:MAG: oxygen-independent coproporphyrinogen III oxidase [Pseudomonadota bacterium]